MSNKIETVSIGDLPIATELDDADELLLRDASADLPENATARLSIATLRAAMGSPDRIESASGDAFVEASKFNGSPRTIARSGVGQGYAIQATFSDGDKSSSELIVKGAGSPSAGIRAEFDEGAYTLSAHGAPLQVEDPIESNHAATKGYVDARPGAEAWSEHAATQDVDLDGHKLTGLGAPTEEDDAATKGYVDGAAPTKIERTFAWGRSVAEVTDNGNVELAVYLTGETAPLRRVHLPNGNWSSAIQITNRSGMTENAWVNTLTLTTSPSPGFSYELSGGYPASSESRGQLRFNGGRFHFYEYGSSSSKPLSDQTHKELPSGVSSYAHAAHLAKEAYDTLASMPAPPDLEWWDPTWTPVANVDSVSNVECSYMRVHRAAGGSLVTLEGTITVTPEAAGLCAVQVDLPIARVGSEPLAGTAMALGSSGGLVVAAASVGSTALALSFVAEGADPYGVPFRISYRAA